MDPTWSPDGNTIAFMRWGKELAKSEIHVMTSAGKYLKRISNPVHNDYHPDWFDTSVRVVSSAGNQITIWGRLKKFAPNLLKSDD